MVAERKGELVTELPPLYDIVDPEALDDLFAPSRGSRRDEGIVVFWYQGYEVTVRADGTISIVEQSNDTEPTIDPAEDDNSL